MNYLLALSEEHAQIVIRALDLYSRIGMGQIDEIICTLRESSIYRNLDANLRQSVEGELDILKRRLIPYGSWGIHNTGISDDFRVAWDIMKVVRHRLAWDRKPSGGMTVDFDYPTTSGRLPLCQITRVDNI